jgi:hypothetical protein
MRRGTWGAGNLDNEGAAQYLAVLATELVATITEITGSRSRLRPGEDGEGMLMPSVDVLAMLCERYGAEPPRPEAVRQWHEKYLKAYDGDDRTEPAPGFRAGRRKVIEQTFRWLESLAEAHWDE